MAKHFSAQASLRQMNVGAEKSWVEFEKAGLV